MNQRIKVLQLHPGYNIRAHDFADLGEQIVKALPCERFETTVGILEGGPAPGEPESRAEHSVYFNFTERQLQGFRLFATWRLYQFCKKEKFDVIICNRFKPVSMLLRLNRWLKVPLCIGIAHGVGEYDRIARRLEVGCLMNNAWRFVGVSPTVKKYLIERRCGFSKKNTLSITNAIDIAQAEALQYPREEARRLLGLDPQARLIGAVGRLVPVKGHIYLIRALAPLKDKYPNVQLAIIGDGREEAHLQEEIVKLGLIGRVKLLGWRANALRYVRAFDLWAMPSLSEGMSLSLMEGMSGHLPVIASDIPAMASVIHGAGGLATSPRDVEALSAALDEYLALNDEQLRAKGEQAYAYLVKNHDIKDFRQAYLKLIDDSLCETGRLPGNKP